MNLFKKYFIFIAGTSLVQTLSPLHSQTLSSPPLDVLRVDFVGGGSTTYELVEKPLLKPELAPRMVAPVKAPVAATAAEIEQNRLWEAKRQVFISWSGTVYNEGVSEVRWWEEGKEFIILSSINFNTFGFLTDFETVDSVYSFMFFLGEDSLRELKDGTRRNQLTLLKSIPSQTSRYVIISPAQGQLSAGNLQTLNDLHRYYDQHQTKLVQDYQELQALQRKQEAWLKANPPQPADSVVTYFPILSDYQEREKP